MEKMDFTSLTGYNLNFPINFGHAATQFLADMPIWVCLTAKTALQIFIVTLLCKSIKSIEVIYNLVIKNFVCKFYH